MIALKCPLCLAAVDKRSARKVDFLGFRQSQCVNCGFRFYVALSVTYRVIYGMLAGGAFGYCAYAYLHGSIVLPGIGFLAMIYALGKDARLRRSQTLLSQPDNLIPAPESVIRVYQECDDVLRRAEQAGGWNNECEDAITKFAQEIRKAGMKSDFIKWRLIDCGIAKSAARQMAHACDG